jgi:hypothetical protein
MAVERLDARTHPGFFFKVYVSIVVLAFTNAH